MFRAVEPLVGRLPRPWRRRARAAGAPQTAPLGVFLAGPDAFGFRTYLTADEARQLAADWVGLLDGFGDRAEDPSRRPDDAVLYEVVVLGRPVQDLVGAARGAGRGRLTYGALLATMAVVIVTAAAYLAGAPRARKSPESGAMPPASDGQSRVPVGNIG